MSVSAYQPSISYVGTGEVSSYSFPFTIQALSQLLVYITDANGNLLNVVRGTDTTQVIDEVTFDPVNGSGTVELLADLPDDCTLLILQANDAPTQPSMFRQNSSFTLINFEMAMDFIDTALQRVAYLAQRSVSAHPLDGANFIAGFPQGLGVIGAANLIPTINDEGTGWAAVDTWLALPDLAAAVAAAAAAQVSATSAASSASDSDDSATASAASAVAAAASAVAAAASAEEAQSHAIRANVVAISNGASSLVVVYSSSFGSAGVPIVSILNLTDPEPIDLGPRITAYSATGFTVSFVAPTDTGNYQLAYTTSGVV